MSKRTDLTGRTFGHLVVNAPAPSRGANAYWTCTCTLCGNTCEVAKSNLLSGRQVTCGCGKEDYLAKTAWAEIMFKRDCVLFKPWEFLPQSKQTDPGKAFWLGVCDHCGTFCAASTTQLKTHQVKSCPSRECRELAQKIVFSRWEDDYLNQTERKRLTRNSYDSMVRRAGDPGTTYENISVCPQWLGPGGFDQFVTDMGLRRHGGFSLERIDVTDGYSPRNCVWATRKVQDRNKTNSVRFNVGGEVINQVDVAAQLNISSKATSRRIKRLVSTGLTLNEAAECLLADAHYAHNINGAANHKGLQPSVIEPKSGSGRPL